MTPYSYTRSNSEKRDFRQRSIGYVSFSLLAHVGLLTSLVIFTNAGSGSLPAGDGDLTEVIASNNAVTDSEVFLVETEAAAVATVVSPKSDHRLPTRAAKAAAPAQPASAPITADESDIQINAALQAARDIRAEPTLASAPPTETRQEVLDETSLETLSPEITDAPESEPEENEAPVVAALQEPAQEQENKTPAATPSSTSGNTNSSSSGLADNNMQMQATAGGGSGRGGKERQGNSPQRQRALVIVEASQRRPLSGNPMPVYPQNDRYLRRQGTTVMVGRVGSDGRMIDVRIEKSSGSQTMDHSSVSAFSKWRFEPGQEALVRKSFAFALTGEEKVIPARLGQGASSQR